LQKLRVAVVGAGAFGRNHLRVLAELPGVEISAVVDTDAARAESAAGQFGCQAHASLERLAAVDAAIVAVPTVSHAKVGCDLLGRGIDVLVEKPIAPDLDSAYRLARSAARSGRILQVGHLERFNPAVTAVSELVTLPLFFEIHRMSVFTPRSLDVDVVLDLMIHDIDIVLSLVRKTPDEIRAAGISILSPKVDIAHVRLAFPGGCVANLTASRVSTERIRKLRVFQPGQYISLDYHRQDGAIFRVSGEKQIGFEPLRTSKDEPLRLELQSFLDCVRRRTDPLVGADDAIRALEVSLDIQKRIDEHARVVAASVDAHAATAAL
jgi:predicted dehydrogenase